MTPEQQQQLIVLLDKQAILELINSYCNAADRKDFDKMRSLYHPDATDDHGGFFKGLASEFIDKLPEIQAPMETLHHNISTVNIKLDGDYAEGEVYVLAMHKVKTDDGLLDLLIGGRYFDKYEKRDGQWKYLHRAVVADWVNTHTPSIIDMNSPLVEGSLIGCSDEKDPSYDFFRLFKRGEQ